MITVLTSEILKHAFSAGYNLEESRQYLLNELSNRGLPHPNDQLIIDTFNELIEYNDHIINDRCSNTARPHFDKIWIWRDFDSLDLETEMPHWYRYQKSLIDAGWSLSEVQSVQRSSTDIFDAIKDAESRKWTKNKSKPVKGLVMGYVQSGKTASMAGVMAIAADYGYDMVIVLSGIHNKLNEQTTRRFENDLWTYAKYAQNHRPRSEATNFVNYLKAHKKSWYHLTSLTDKLVEGQDQFFNLSKPIFGVFKKNIKVLEYLNTWKKNNSSYFDNNLKLLIIDDECDQASPNVKDYSSNEESAINGELTKIIHSKHFPYVSYIGYTATPFASILNQPPGHKSLYPEDFIHCLPKPTRYFGVEQVFGNNDDGSDSMAVVIKDIEGSKQEKMESLKSELRKAVSYFICACAARYHVRNHLKHTTMLVHTSSRVKDHEEWKTIIEDIINNFKEYPQKLIATSREVWNEQMGRMDPTVLSSIFGIDEIEFQKTERFSSIKDHLLAVLEGSKFADPLAIAVDNSKAEENDKLQYPNLDDDINKPRPVIAVGGNTLSRGLTLEGLTVSFFLREVNQMDSLLQMGRWFGYRRGYEDLVRIWTTQTTLDNFRHIGNVELDIRDQVNSLYTSYGITPDEVAITVKTHPGLRIVRRSAMQAATNKAVYFGIAPQTYYFKHRDKKWLRDNWNAANDLLKNLNFTTNLYANIGSYELFNFFDCIKVHELHEKMMGPHYLKKFIMNANDNGHLLSWNVAVASTLKDEDLKPNFLESYKYIVRSKIKGSPPGYKQDANIKTLRSPGDLFIDMDISVNNHNEKNIAEINSPAAREKLFEHRNIRPEERPGLLLLYPIKKHAEPHEIRGKHRVNLDAVHDVLGWSIVLPDVDKKNRVELYERVGIEI